MTIAVACQCGKRFSAKPELAGKRVACPACKAPLSIPAASPTGTAASAPAATIQVSCLCGKSLKAQPHLAGKTVRCPACQQPVQVPFTSGSQPSVPQIQFAAAPAAKANDDFWNDLPMTPAMVPGAGPSAAPQAFAAHHATMADQFMNSARAEEVEKTKDLDAWGTGKIFSGIGMMVGATVWFVVGLMAGRIFFYPPILFVMGVIALINGISQKVSR